jgi:hypothetical protein
MPAKSENQQQAAGMALAVKRGKLAVNKLKGAAKQMYNSMNETQLKHYAETATKALPTSKKAEDAYVQGFIAKCAECGVDPVELVKHSAWYTPALEGATRTGRRFANRLMGGKVSDLTDRLDTAVNLPLLQPRYGGSVEQLEKMLAAERAKVLYSRLGAGGAAVGAPVLAWNALNNENDDGGKQSPSAAVLSSAT